jgi:hypothetical protein
MNTQEREQIIQEDCRLTADELAEKYDPDVLGGRHPVYAWWDWLQVVAQGRTLVGYWTWVTHQIEDEIVASWRKEEA